MRRFFLLLCCCLLGITGALPSTALPPDLSPGWYAHIVTTKGVIVVRLLPQQAPQAVAHFAALAEGRLAWADLVTGESRTGRYYDGLMVHKAMAGQRFEAGDATGTGRGAPMIYLPPEGFGPVDFSKPYRMGMTRAAQGKVSAVLFFISAGTLPWLNGKHPCFGEVVSGQDVVWEIATAKTSSDNKPLVPIVLESVRVLKVGDAPPLPEPVPYTPPTPKFEARRRPPPVADPP